MEWSIACIYTFKTNCFCPEPVYYYRYYVLILLVFKMFSGILAVTRHRYITVKFHIVQWEIVDDVILASLVGFTFRVAPDTEWAGYSAAGIRQTILPDTRHPAWPDTGY